MTSQNIKVRANTHIFDDKTLKQNGESLRRFNKGAVASDQVRAQKQSHSICMGRRHLLLTDCSTLHGFHLHVGACTDSSSVNNTSCKTKPGNIGFSLCKEIIFGRPSKVCIY